MTVHMIAGKVEPDPDETIGSWLDAVQPGARREVQTTRPTRAGRWQIAAIELAPSADVPGWTIERFAAIATGPTWSAARENLAAMLRRSAS